MNNLSDVDGRFGSRLDLNLDKDGKRNPVSGLDVLEKGSEVLIRCGQGSAGDADIDSPPNFRIHFPLQGVTLPSTVTVAGASCSRLVRI